MKRLERRLRQAYVNAIWQEGKLVFEKNAVIARPVRTLVVAIPRLARKCSENFPEDWDSPRFLVVIVTWFLSTGGLPRQCAHWLAMTASIRLTPIKVIGFNKLVVKFKFVGFVPPIVGRGYDPAAHVPMREMYVLP